MFDDWRGSFYPSDLPVSHWLGWYDHVFNTVEIESTFHSIPTEQTVGHWLASASAHFRFTCKAPKGITHDRRLRGCEAVMEQFLESMRPLHGRLGPILIQLPAGFSPEDDGTALREFVLGLPHGWKFAIEFPGADWHQPRFVKLLEDHGVCWAWSDMTSVADQDVAPFGFLPVTADFLYVRLMGDRDTRYDADGKQVFHYKEKHWSRDAAIESWAVRLHKHADDVKGIYVLCSNHYEGFAPATCAQLGARLGVDIALPRLAEAEPALDGRGQLKLL
jgi:uncharacterized protein YecE (DUF72 family)